MRYDYGMEPKENEPIQRFIKITLVVLGLLLAVLLIFLVRDYLALRRANIINHRELSLSAFVQKHGPLNASDIDVVRPWMTFDYVNRLFGLPNDYLKDQLQISDPRYPRLTLNDPQTVHDVQNAILNYFNQPAI